MCYIGPAWDFSKTFTLEGIKLKIINNDIFGFAKVDIRCHDNGDKMLHDFDLSPPIFVNKKYLKKMLGRS